MSYAIPFGAACISVLGWTLAPGVARAESATAPLAVYVLSIATEDADDQAEGLSQALRWSVRQAPGWTLLESHQSFETLAIALKCPPQPDPACLLRIGEQLHADRYVWGTMGREGAAQGEVHVELHLWARDKPSVTARETYLEGLKDPASDSLRALASSLFSELTGGADQAQTTPGAGVAIADREPPGPRDGSGHGFPVRTALAYSAVAVGVGFLVTSGLEAAFWVSDDQGSTQDRTRVPKSVTDVCTYLSEPAQDACSKGRDALSASRLAWIFAGAGVLFAGTGIGLVATERASSGPLAAERDESKVHVVPSLERRAGSVTVRVAW